MATAANGGSGVVIIRIPCGPASTSVAPGTNQVSNDGSAKIARFTVTGTLTL